jgi:hypothetical protein
MCLYPKRELGHVVTKEEAIREWNEDHPALPEPTPAMPLPTGEAFYDHYRVDKNPPPESTEGTYTPPAAAPAKFDLFGALPDP